MFCVICGKSLNNDFKICPYCGTKVINETTLNSSNGFDIRDGVLVKYNGRASNVVIPEGVKIIGEYAFCEEDKYRKINGNKYIEKITLPNTVIEIEQCAFFGCVKLISIALPNSISKIGRGAFSGCKELTSVVLPEGLTEIEACTFAGCKKLDYVYIPQTVTKIKANAFIVYSDSVYSAPFSCPLRKTKIPDSVTYIEKTNHDYYLSSNSDFRHSAIYYGGISLYKIDENIIVNKNLLESIRKENKLCVYCGHSFSFFGKCKRCGKRKNY